VSFAVLFGAASIIDSGERSKLITLLIALPTLKRERERERERDRFFRMVKAR
jgi:hypothetical protein